LSLPWKPFWKKNYGDKRSGRGDRGGGREDCRKREDQIEGADQIMREESGERTKVHHGVEGGFGIIEKTPNKYKILKMQNNKSKIKSNSGRVQGNPR
jgi:hypothetical protein